MSDHYYFKERVFLKVKKVKMLRNTPICKKERKTVSSLGSKFVKEFAMSAWEQKIIFNDCILEYHSFDWGAKFSQSFLANYPALHCCHHFQINCTLIKFRLMSCVYKTCLALHIPHICHFFST